MTTITKTPFGVTRSGEPVTAWTLDNGRGMSVRILDYGATVQSLVVPDRNGNPVDVALGYDDLAGYESGSSWFGGTIGRYANRIANAAFTLNGKEYTLPKNDGENHLHGVFSRRVFSAAPEDGALCMRLVSPDGEDGFPGTVHVAVTYRLTESGKLRIEYRAETDADTYVNLTNHTYFNLAGHGDILEHRMRLAASHFTEAGAGTLPTGRILPVDGTPLDFRTEKAIGAEISADDPQLLLSLGYDHNYVLDKAPGLAPCGEVWSPETGILLAFSTTQPGVQFYSGNYVDRDASPSGKNGVRYPQRGGFCLESQRFPDSPNQPQFPSALLRPHEKYSETTVFQFSIRE